MNKNIKPMIFTDIPRSQIKRISKVTVFCVLGYFGIFYAISKFPLVLVGIIENTVPIFTSLFGVILLREKLTILNVVCLVISFAGVIVLITGGNDY